MRLFLDDQGLGNPTLDTVGESFENHFIGEPRHGFGREKLGGRLHDGSLERGIGYSVHLSGGGRSQV